MNKFKNNLIFVGVILTIAAFGCGQRAENSNDAIELSKAKTTVEEQAKFLVQQANSFIKSEKFDEAINTAKYILSKLDSNSTEAKSIIEKAKVELKKLADQKLAEAKDKIGNFGQ